MASIKKFVRDPFWQCAFAILLLALILRTIHVATIYHSPHSDELTYWQMAIGQIDIFRSQPSGYPFFLKFLIAISSTHSFFFFRLANAVLGSLSIILVIGITRKLFDSSAALIAGFLMAIYRPYIISCGLILAENLTLFLLVSMVFCMVKLMERITPWPIVLLMLTGALVLHVRTNSLTVIPLVFAVAFLYQGKRKNLLRRSLMMGFTVIVIILMTLPCSIQASKLAGRNVFISPNGRQNFRIAHNQYAYGGFVNIRKHPEKIGEDVQFVKDYFNQEVYWLLFEKIDRLFESRIFPWLKEDDHYDTPLGNILFLYLIQIQDLLPIGIIGILIAFQLNRNGSILLLSFFIFYVAVFMIFFANPRFRIPVDFCIIIFSAVVISRLKIVLSSRVGKFVLIAYFSAGVLWTMINYYRFSGPNLISNGDFSRFDADDRPLGFKEVHGMLVKAGQTGVLIGYSSQKKPAILSSEYPMNPKKDPYMVFSFKCICKSKTVDRTRGIKFKLIVMDKDGEWLYKPIESIYYVVNGFRPNWVKVWRRFRIPIRASRIRIEIVSDLDGQFEITDLSIRGMRN